MNSIRYTWNSHVVTLYVGQTSYITSKLVNRISIDISVRTIPEAGCSDRFTSKISAWQNYHQRKLAKKFLLNKNSHGSKYPDYVWLTHIMSESYNILISGTDKEIIECIVYPYNLKDRYWETIKTPYPLSTWRSVDRLHRDPRRICVRPDYPAPVFAADNPDWIAWTRCRNLCRQIDAGGMCLCLFYCRHRSNRQVANMRYDFHTTENVQSKHQLVVSKWTVGFSSGCGLWDCELSRKYDIDEEAYMNTESNGPWCFEPVRRLYDLSDFTLPTMKRCFVNEKWLMRHRIYVS